MRYFFLTFLLFFTSHHSAWAGQTFSPFTGKPDKCITVQEEDGSPSNTGCWPVKVTNGTLTDNTGSFSLVTGGGGGAGDIEGVTAGAGLSGGGTSGTVSLATDSSEAAFIAAGALTCGAGTAGKIQIHTTPLQYCDNAATPALQYTAYGSSTGVATSATALAADPADCGANTFATTIAANGVLTCASIADADVPNTITIDNATTAANLGADGVDALTEIAQAIKTAANDTSPLVIGTAGSNGEIAKWNTDGTLTDNNVILGTMTNTKFCTYTAVGTVINCASDGGGESTTVSDTTTVNLTLTGTNITADGLYTAGDNLTLTLADFDLDAAISLVTSVTSPIFVSNNADPADAGIVRLGNAESIAWEAAPAGTDITLSVDASEVMQVSGALNAVGAVTGSNLSGTNTGDNTVATSGDSATSFFASGTLEETLLPDSAAVSSWNLTTPTFTTTALLVGILQDNDDMVFEADANSDGANKFSFTDGAAIEVASISEAGLISVLVGIDAIGAVDMDYGSADVTDHTFITDGTTDADFVVPLTSIGAGEIVSGSLTATQLGTDSVSADELNATGVEAELESALDIGGEVTSTGMASTVIADSIAVTGWTMTTPTVSGDITYSGTQPVFSIWLGANSAILPTSGYAEIQDFAGTNFTYRVLAFDTTTSEKAYWQFPLPDNIIGTTCTFQTYWTNKSGASAETFTLEIDTAGVANEAAFDSAALGGTVTDVTDTWLAQNSMHISAATAITTDWTAGDFAVVYANRDVVTDNMAGDALLFGVKVECSKDSESE